MCIQLVEETRDFSGSTAYELALDVALSIVRFGRFSQFDMQEQLRSPALSFKNFQDFVSGAMLRSAVDCLLMGDISPSQAESAALKFVEQIRHEPLPYTQAASSKVRPPHLQHCHASQCVVHTYIYSVCV